MPKKLSPYAGAGQSMDVDFPKDPQEAEDFYHDLFFNKNYRQSHLGFSTPLDYMSEKAVDEIFYGKDKLEIDDSGLVSRFLNCCKEVIASGSFNSPEELFHAFLSSGNFKNLSIIPEHKVSMTIDEAFYQFIQDHHPQKISPAGQNEFYTSIFKLLAANNKPSFQIEDPSIIYRESVWLSIQPYAIDNSKETPLTLYMLKDGQFINGQITHLIADILRIFYSDSENELTNSYSKESIDITVEQLQNMNFI